MDKGKVVFRLLVLATLRGSDAVLGDKPGPFHIHSPVEYAPGANQWDKVTEVFEKFKERYFGMNSSNALPHPPHVSYHNVNMSDGTKLSTVLINPYPYDSKKGTVIARSPYGPTSENIADIFVLKGMAAVLQDDRGTFTSGGKFDIWRTAEGDGLATMQWITSKEWSNGEVYSVGASADGINEATQILAQPPMLKGQWWMWTTGSGHHFSYPGGAYRQDLIDGYFGFMNIEIHNAGKRVINEMRENEALGAWWNNITICADHTKLHSPNCHWNQVKWPIVLLGGWWDIFQKTSVDAWNAIRVASDPSVRDKHVHIVAPLGHCIISTNDVHPVLAAAETASILASAELASEYFMGNFAGPTRSRLERLNFYVMGGFDGPSKGSWNYWTSLDKWPTFTPKAYYLDAKSSLSDASPEQLCTAEYDYDPKNPSPMIGGNNLPIPGYSKITHCGHADLTPREKRDDVITFDSAPLSADMAVVGAIKAKMFVSSSAIDTDFFVTLSDLSANKSVLIRYGMVRMRWRDSELTRSPSLVPDKVYEVEMELASTAYVFPKGHRVRVSVSSAADPYYHPNSNTGKFDLIEKVTPVVAHNVVHMGPKYPSQITLPIVNIKDIPENKNFPGMTNMAPLPIVV